MNIGDIVWVVGSRTEAKEERVCSCCHGHAKREVDGGVYECTVCHGKGTETHSVMKPAEISKVQIIGVHEYTGIKPPSGFDWQNTVSRDEDGLFRGRRPMFSDGYSRTTWYGTEDAAARAAGII